MALSALFTDHYQFTMFDTYVSSGEHERQATFDLFFREAPDGAPFAIACGLDIALEFIEQFRFGPEDLKFLKEKRLVSPTTLKILKTLRFSGDVLALPEGTPALPQEPLLRISGPIGLLMLLESPLLNLINFQTLIATKASRLVRAAHPATITEFGLRRAHGHSAALLASRTAFIGGAVATSNVEASQRYGIPSLGTMSHSYVMSFPDELSAFRAYTQAHPTHSILLVDTYDTLSSGVPHAITVAKEVQKRGGQVEGIRIDSGNLVDISKSARRMLDQAGLKTLKIFASNDLDEYQLLEFKTQKAPIDAYGIGTRLVTAYSQPSLGCIYKLCAIQDDAEHWMSKMKTTSDPHKATLPGRKVLFRITQPDGKVVSDLLALEGEDVSQQSHFTQVGTHQKVPTHPSWIWSPLLKPVWKGTQRLHHPKPLSDLQAYCRHQLSTLPDTTLRLHHPTPIPLLLSPQLLSSKS